MPVTPQSQVLALGPAGPRAVVLNTDPRLAEHIAFREALEPDWDQGPWSDAMVWTSWGGDGEEVPGWLA